MTRQSYLPLFGLVWMFLLVMAPLPAVAVPAITCHCFTDRSFDPARPAAADPYFLASGQNSFLAAVFDVDKKTIVMKKQKGTSSDDLWIACTLASVSGAPLDTVLAAKQSKASWQEVATTRGISPKSAGARFAAALQAHASPARLAEAAADDLLDRYRVLGATDLAALRKAGATNQEVILSGLISRKSKQPAPQLYLQVKSGAKTWGRLLQGAKVETTQMEREIATLLSPQR